MDIGVRIPTVCCLSTKYEIILPTSTHSNLSVPSQHQPRQQKNIKTLHGLLEK